MAEIQSLARGLKILEIMAKYDNGVGITDLADQLMVNKATASRLVSTLMAHGFVSRSSQGRTYQLGPMLVSLSRHLINRMPLRDTAKPFLRQLVELSGECAHLAIYARGKALYIDQVESVSSLRVNAEVGQMAPLHCTALGKVLLSFGNFPVPGELENHTPHTITDPTILLDELHKVHQQGFAIDNEEFDEGVRCIAAPVCDFRGKLLGAIGISGPAARLNPERMAHLIPEVVTVASQLSNMHKFKKT